MQKWTTFRSDIIQSFLTDLIDQSGVIVWQQMGEKRLVCSAKFKNVAKSSCDIELSPSDLNNNTFNLDTPIFVHAKMRDIVFKQQIGTLNDHNLTMELPQEILVGERRSSERFPYKVYDQKEVAFFYEPENKSIRGILSNISQGGAAFLIEKKQHEMIENSTELFLSELIGNKFESPYRTEVRHVSSVSIDAVEYWKVGVQFKDGEHAIITDEIKQKAKKVEGLSSEVFCGLSDEEQTEKLNKIRSENEQLAKNIEKNLIELDRMRYLTDQMKSELLGSIDLDLLACALRLSNKELVYDLFYDSKKYMQEEFMDKLAVAKPASAVCKAQDSVVKFLKQKQNDGEFKMDPKNVTAYV